MPQYKNRARMEASTELRRYITLDGLFDIFRNRRLRFTRIDKFNDRFEGSVPKRQIDDQLPLFASRKTIQMMHHMSMPFRPNHDPWIEMTLRRRAKIRSAHASCWTAGPESEAMWRLYCRDDGVEGQGVALQSTLGKIEASIARHDLYVAPVMYRHYHEGNAFDDELDPFMHKRLGFACEREVRLLKYDHEHYFRLTAALTAGDPGAAQSPELSDYIFLDWSPSEVIERITISPYASAEYEAQVRDAISSVDPSDRVDLSVLNERRYGPQF